MNCLIYCITCAVSGKKYIGLTQMTLQRRWQSHVWVAITGKANGPLQLAIRKYGLASFSIEILERVSSRAAANEAERRLIIQHGTKTPHGYNLTEGGDGGYTGPQEYSEERRRKISERLTGRKLNPEHVERTASKLRGRKLSEAHAAIVRTAGRNNKGKKHTAEQVLAFTIQRVQRGIEKIDTSLIGIRYEQGKYRTTIGYRGRRFEIGQFGTVAEAKTARRKAAEAYLQELQTGVQNPMFKHRGREGHSAKMREVWRDPEYKRRVGEKIKLANMRRRGHG